MTIDRRQAPLAAVALAWVVFIWGWRASVLTLPVDDAYYYMQIARNVARGEGATFGGGGVTSGFHPLWLGVLVPIARVFGDAPDTYVRAVLTLDVALVVAGALVLARVGPSVLWLTPLALVPFHSAKVLLNGQESALAWLLVTLCVARLFARERRSELVDGALAGALVLARLSALPFALTFLLVPMLEATPPTRAALVRGARALAVMACIVGAWLVWLLVETGHVVTVSASIKMGSAGAVRLAALFGLACVAAALVFARRRPRAAWLAPLLAQVAAEVSVSLLRGVLVPEIWTLVPHLTLAIGLLGGALPGRARAPAFALATVCSLGLGAASWRLRLEPQSWSVYASARRAGEWVSANTPRSAVVAGWDCGVAALFADRRFYPLDGLVGTWSYKRDVLDAGQVEAFVHRQEVDYLVQYLTLEQLAEDPSVAFEGVRLAPMDVAWSECGVFRAALAPREPWAYAYFVLRRAPGTAPLGAIRTRPCVSP